MPIIETKLIYSRSKRRKSAKSYIIDLLKNRPNTYNDKKFTEIQCRRSKYRTIYEVYCILKTEYTSLTWKRYLSIVFSLVDCEETAINLWYCFHVSGIVFNSSVSTDKDENFPFLKRIGSTSWHSAERIEQTGFKHKFANLENLNKYYKKYNEK